METPDLPAHLHGRLDEGQILVAFKHCFLAPEAVDRLLVVQMLYLREYLTFFLKSAAPSLRNFPVPCLRGDLLHDIFFFCSRLTTIHEVRIPIFHQF